MPLTGGAANSTVSGEIMLFGVRVVVDSMRKSVSMNNLSQYQHPHDRDPSNHKHETFAAGYVSADDTVPPNSGHHRDRERKRGIPWTEEEHKLFLVGLQKVGKGDWRGISRNYVKTRTPTQVASHAQKYFLRRSNHNHRRRRSSLFDITTDTVSAIPMEEEQIQHYDNECYSQPHCLATPERSNFNGFPMMPFYHMGIGYYGVISAQVGNPVEKELTLEQVSEKQNGNPIENCIVPVVPAPKASAVSDITANSSFSVDTPILSLGLSLSSAQRPISSTHSALVHDAMPYFNNGARDNIISVV